MKQLRTRLLSAALAACMAVSVLPVSALALGGGIDPENGVSAQAQTGVRLNGGETINDTTITPDGVYYLDGTSDYTQGITIATSKDVIININGDMTYTGTTNFVMVTSAKTVTVNNAENHVFQSETAGKDFLRVEGDGIAATVHGGVYQMGFSQKGKSEMTLQDVTASEKYENALNNHIGTMTVIGGKYSNINASGGRQPTVINSEDGTLIFRGTEVTGEQYGAIINKSGTTMIYGGEYSSCKNVILAENGRVEIYGGHFSSTGTNPTIAIGNSSNSSNPVTDAQFIVHAGTFEKEQGGQIFFNWGNLTIDNDAGETLVNNPSGTAATVISYNKLYFKGGTITSPESRAISVATNTPASIHSYAEITGGTIKNSKYGIHVSRNDPTVILENVTFENNENDIYLGDGQKITIKDTFTDPATVKVAESPITTPRQITTSDAPNQQNLKLTSNDGYLVAYNSTGNYRYLTEKTAGKYTVTAEHATAAADLGSGEETLYSYTEIDKGTKVTLKADPAPAGEAFDGWEVLVDGTPNDALLEDNDAEETHFWMPTGSVTVRAKYKTVIDPVDPSGADNIKGALSAVVVGAAAGAILYEAGTGIYRAVNMPGIILPSNRIELADLIWERAGKPEPQNTDLYDDIDEDDTDWQKAARWMVEQELMDDDIDEEKDTEKFHPYRMVTKLRVCLTWQKAKDQGLFDNTETKAE